MKVYVILREYSNNVAIVDATYSSNKKAKAHIDNIKYWCDKDGWSVVKKARYMSTMEGEVECIEIQSPSGRIESTERYYIIPQEVK